MLELSRSSKVNLVEEFESRHSAMKVAELSEILGVDDKHIYRMAAQGRLPSFRVGASLRFDPQEVAKWLRSKYRVDDAATKKLSSRIRPTRTENSHIA